MWTLKKKVDVITLFSPNHFYGKIFVGSRARYADVITLFSPNHHAELGEQSGETKVVSLVEES
jgi:hypothetical protein